MRSARILGSADDAPLAMSAFHWEYWPALDYLPAMSQTLEMRVEDLEKKIAALSAEPTLLSRKKSVQWI